MNDSPRLIAEIGCNHKGDMSVACEMIKLAAQFCRVHVVKFQKRTVRELLPPEEFRKPHPTPAHSYGQTYGEHREFLEFSPEQHRQLAAWCEEWGVGYSTSVWDLTAAKQMGELKPAMLKVPSASNADVRLVEWLLGEYRGKIHISLGMTSRREEEALVERIVRFGRGDDCILYACTSGYPVAFEDICLMEIPRLIAAYGKSVSAIGFSGHHLGFAADVAALALGARWFERHFTLDRTWKGTDHAASLEPDGMRRLARDLRNVSLALRPKSQEILPVEAEQRRKLKRIIDA